LSIGHTLALPANGTPKNSTDKIIEKMTGTIERRVFERPDRVKKVAISTLGAFIMPHLYYS